MNLAQVLHARWAATAALNELLPVGKVMTGAYFAANPGTRYGTITLPGSRTTGFFNDQSSLEVMTVRVRIHHDDYDQGQAIVAALLAAFDRSEFSLADGSRVVCMQRSGLPQEMQDPRTGQWDWVTDFQCRVHCAAA
jgi:hypothetical protein